ncbi:MAG: hypothetical protein R3Y21_03170 [Mycoplasmatota bacterium]
MARFKLNINQLLSSNNSLKDKYNLYSEDEDTLQKITLSADGSWNDNNTEQFIKSVKSDETITSKHNDTVYNCINEIDKFGSSLINLLSNNDCINAKTIVYDTDYCNNSINIMNDAITLLSSAKSKINSANTACSASSSISDVYNKIISSTSNISDIKKKLNNVTSGIVETISDSTKKINSFETVVVEDNELKYEWDSVSFIKDRREIFEKDTTISFEKLKEEISVSETKFEKPILNEKHDSLNTEINSNYDQNYNVSRTENLDVNSNISSVSATASINVNKVDKNEINDTEITIDADGYNVSRTEDFKSDTSETVSTSAEINVNKVDKTEAADTNIKINSNQNYNVNKPNAFKIDSNVNVGISSDITVNNVDRVDV